MRKYRAFYDNGHDTGEFEFCSNHIKGSKANLKDAYRQYHKHYGYSKHNTIKITDIYLIK